jgi:phospholipase/carboxylesterase
MAYDHDLLPGAPGAPAVAALHGTGGDRASFGALARRLAPAATVLALDGDVREGPMRRFFRREGEGRYDMADLALRTGRLADFLTARFAGAGIDPARATGLGYSNGANILANLLLTGRGPLRRMALMHPLIPFRVPDPAVPAGAEVLITAGRRDPICPPATTEALAATLSDAGAAVALFWHDGGHEATADELAAVAAFLGRAPARAAA